MVTQILIELSDKYGVIHFQIMIVFVCKQNIIISSKILLSFTTINTF